MKRQLLFAVLWLLALLTYGWAGANDRQVYACEHGDVEACR